MRAARHVAARRKGPRLEPQPTPARTIAIDAHRHQPTTNAMSEIATIIMYRPTGPEKLELVRQNGSRRWPPRLHDQPIFYPVTNEAYAVQIARD